MPVLYYIHDPMCSWCWGYRPVWLELKAALPIEVRVENVLGGLAPDNDQPMPGELRHTIQGHWRNIHARLGTKFNFDFWTLCVPRRDTYKACRAVVVAARQNLEEEMIHAIQQGYYLRAMNPSDPDTLVRLAGEIGMDMPDFSSALVSEKTETEFMRQLQLRRALGVRSFPSLVVKLQHETFHISLDYRSHHVSVHEIRSLLQNSERV